MGNRDTNHQNRTELLKKIGPDIAKQMSIALQKLISERVRVEFHSIETDKKDTVHIHVDEKCFGSYVHFKCLEASFRAIVVLFFPLSSVNIFTELLLKRYHKENSDDRMKLSAFKEAVNILALTYITEMANSLKVKFKMNIPRFICFRDIELLKSEMARRYSHLDGLVSIGQFNIHGESNSSSRIKGRFVVVF